MAGESSMTQNLIIHGMTCANCVRHVKEALLDVPGVVSADVDLNKGRAAVETTAEIPRAVLAGVLNDAGYSLG